MKKAILLSGGMDSVSLAYWYRSDIELAITINYGQKSANREIEVSKKICKELNFKHEILTIDCSSIGSGEMCNGETSALSPVPEWWPYRNQLLITLASMNIISKGIVFLLFGAVKTDNKYIDGTHAFFKAINKTINMQEGKIKILTPAIKLTTIELIKGSKIPESLLFWSHSCHKGNDPCGICNGCLKYMEVVEELNNSQSNGRWNN